MRWCMWENINFKVGHPHTHLLLWVISACDDDILTCSLITRLSIVQMTLKLDKTHLHYSSLWRSISITLPLQAILKFHLTSCQIKSTSGGEKIGLRSNRQVNWIPYLQSPNLSPEADNSLKTPKWTFKVWYLTPGQAAGAGWAVFWSKLWSFYVIPFASLAACSRLRANWETHKSIAPSVNQRTY